MSENGCCANKRERTEAEYEALVRRLTRIEGQVRGIRRMLEEQAYCAEILTQASAASAALNAFSRELLEQHIRVCVAEDLREGRDEKLEELMGLLKGLMK